MKHKKPKIGKKPWHKKPTYGSLYTVKGSPHIYISMNYYHRRLRFPTDKIDTEENWKELRTFMDEVGISIRKRTFVFAKTFYWLDQKTKNYFSALEGREPALEPDCTTFGEYARRYMDRKSANFTAQKRRSYNCALNRILPYFEHHPFDKITTAELEKFIDTLIKSNAPESPLAAKTMKNILVPMSAIWRAAYNEFNWNLRDPFPTLNVKYDEIQDKLDRLRALRRFNKVQEEKTRLTFLLSEWERLMHIVDPHYHIVMELLIRGMIGSELEGLLKEDIMDDHISVCHKVYHESVKHRLIVNEQTVVKKEHILHFSFKLKTWYRERNIPFSGRLKNLLVDAMKQSNSQALIHFKDITIPANKFALTMKDGSPFSYKNFCTIWNKAMTEAGITRRVPYACRHTFVQWALLIGITKTRLVDIMGHADKSMIDKVYGNYRDGLVDERERILEYLGEDFLSLEELRVAFPHRFAARLAAEASKAQNPSHDGSTTVVKGVQQLRELIPDNYPK